MPGHIFSTPGKGISGWIAQNLTVTPSGQHTDRFHFGVIGDPIQGPDGKIYEYETRESLYKGPSCDRFFEQYMDEEDIEMYRVPGLTLELGIRAVRSTSKIGHAFYGYKDFIVLFWDAANNMFHGKFPPYTSQQLKYSADSEYICTEEAAYAMRAIDKPIEPPGQEEIWDIPTVYRQAEEEARLFRYYKGPVGKLKALVLPN